MAQIGKTTFVEWVGKTNPGESPTEAFALDRSVAQRVVIVDWDSRQQAIRDFLGYAQVVVGNAGGKFISREVPRAYPDAVTPNGEPFMFANRIDPVVGKGVPDGRNMKGPGRVPVDGDIARYAKAFMTVHYDAPPWETVSDATMRAAGYVDGNNNIDESTLTRYIIKTEEPSGQMITMPTGIMKFCNAAVLGAKQVNTELLKLSPPKMIPIWNVKVSHVHLPEAAVGSKFYNPNLAGQGSIDTCLGCVNDAAFPASGPFAGCFPQGRLLYVAANITPHRSPLGLRIYDLTHFFQFTPQARHNQVPYKNAADNFAWIEISTDGTAYADTIANNGKHIYDAADFSAIFKPPA